MRMPFGWGLVTLAIAATAIAIWAGPNLTIALPVAVVAVASASLLFVEVALASAESREPQGRAGAGPDPSDVRVAFVSGNLGRQKLVQTLDLLERAGGNAERRASAPGPPGDFRAMSAEEFRDYLRDRLDSLEARS